LKYTAAAKFINRSSILQYGVKKQISTPDGYYIREFSKEEILKIFDFMDKFKIPFTDFLFSQLCVKYATGEIAIYNQDEFGLK
ncbi:MAG: hypothetical protein K2J20_06025, partial [Bacilli bacterium]|nr:hypothetical protein [Bacilli bacterium]